MSRGPKPLLLRYVLQTFALRALDIIIADFQAACFETNSIVNGIFDHYLHGKVLLNGINSISEPYSNAVAALRSCEDRSAEGIV